jgi:UDP-GlcNAc3NAcA epimerase
MPEEVNRIVTDRIARWLFTPTAAAAQHLTSEGVEPERIIPVGDVMYDVALHHGARVDASGRTLGALKLAPGAYALATIHRAENTDDAERLARIVDALESVAKRVAVVWPVHPRTRGVLRQSGRLSRPPAGMHLIEPVGYLDMLQLEKYAAVIATDSGGVQKEAFFHHVPCVTLRHETEWVELVDAGWNRLAPPTSAQTMGATLLAAIGTRGDNVKPYGDGDAAHRIVRRVCSDLAA